MLGNGLCLIWNGNSDPVSPILHFTFRVLHLPDGSQVLHFPIFITVQYLPLVERTINPPRPSGFD
jgi:hypothetical protein